MNSLLRHLSAMQAAAAISVTTAALLALPLLAADHSAVTGLTNEFYAKHIVSLFQKTGAEIGTYDNRTLDRSGFDFAAYVSNTCFRPTENDLSACKQEFGPLANLKETHDNGTLNLILKEISYLAGAAQFVPSPMETEAAVDHSSDTAPSNGVVYVTPIEAETRDRSVELWKICNRKESSRDAALRCYQRNIRRTQSWSEDAMGNVY